MSMPILYLTHTEPNLLTLESFEKRNGETVNVIAAIGGDYMNLGIFLLNDDTGAIMEGITTRPRDTYANIKRVIVSTWLRGEGKRPATWRTLIKVLNVLKLRVLAQDISNALIDSKPAYYNVDACTCTCTCSYI